MKRTKWGKIFAEWMPPNYTPFIAHMKESGSPRANQAQREERIFSRVVENRRDGRGNSIILGVVGPRFDQ